MIDHFTQYVGSAPDASPAVLCAIAHMQTREGVWYPLGGTGAVPRALARLARDLGVDRSYQHLAHHNFVFSRDPHEEFDIKCWTGPSTGWPVMADSPGRSSPPTADRM